ncbi:MAG: hypothetical protein RJA99_2433 [Pseudomonadota bacterium]|jgi:hypothetical protein
MGVVETLLRHGPVRPVEVARVAAALRADPAAGLAAVARLALTLDERVPAPSARLEALEALRPAWVATVEPTVGALRNRPIPLAPDELAAFHRLALALRALRDAWRRLHVALRDARPDGPSAPGAPDARLALARALDAQSRLLVAACRLRIAVPRDDWDALCRLAVPVWAANALDERPAVGGRVHGGDAPAPRAALVVPLLMRLLEPLGLGGAALELAYAVARHTGRRAGVRIDADGLPHVGAYGPALRLSIHHTVRLDTRDALLRLARCRARLASGASPASVGLRTWLSPVAVDALLGRLEAIWAPGHMPTPLTRPLVPRALLRIGLPPAADAAGGPALADDASPAPPDAAALAAGRRLYRYGRRTAAGHGAGGFEFARVASATPTVPRPDGSARNRDDAARSLMEAAGEPVEWRGRDARRVVFARTAAAPRLRLGDLVAVLPVRGPGPATRRRPGSGPARPMVGRVVSLAQTGAADGRKPSGHDVGVEFWPGTAVPVRVCIGEALEREGAWWLPGTGDGDPPSLLLPPDRFVGPVDVLVDEPAGERRMRLLRRIDCGPGHDRIALGARE